MKPQRRFAHLFASEEGKKRISQVQAIAATTANLPAEVQSLLPEIDWDGWAVTARQLRSGGGDGEVLWSAVTTLIPATLSWLRVYRHNQPQLFSSPA